MAFAKGSLSERGQKIHLESHQPRRGVTNAQNPATDLNYHEGCVVKLCLTTHSSSTCLCKHKYRARLHGKNEPGLSLD